MIPIKLTIENFVSHIYSVLDFTEFDAALIIGSFEGNPDIANGVGKSSIMEAIRFAMYGKCKFSKKGKVVKRGEVSCKVEFIFSVDGEEFKIVRSLNIKTGIIILDFTRKVGDKYQPEGYTCDTPSATNRKIIETVGMNDDTFVNIVYFRQNDLSGFAYARVTKRKEILKEALQIGIWDEFQKVSKIYEKKLEEKKKILDDRLEPLKNVEEETIVNVEKLKENEEQVAKIKEEIEKLEKDLAALPRPVGNKKELVVELQQIKDRLEEILKQRISFKERVKVNNKGIGIAHNESSMLEDRLVNYYLEALAIPHEDRNKIKNLYKQRTGKKAPRWSCDVRSLEEKVNVKNEYDKKVSQYKIDLERLTSLEPGKECPVCLTEMKNPKGVEKRRKAKKKFLEKCIEEVVVEVRELDREIGKERTVIVRAKRALIEIERTELIISKHMASISELTKDNEMAQKDFANIAKEWSELNKRMLSIQQHLDGVEDNPTAGLSELREELIKLSIEQGNIKGHGEVLEGKQSEKETIGREIGTVSSSMAVYSKLSKAFGKDGIQAIILENITEDLRQFANSVLKNIYYRPISIDFVTQKQTGSGSWKEDFDIIIDMDGEKYDFEDISGGEQVRISIAIRLALSQLLMRRIGSNVKFLLFDEVDQALDRHGLEALAETISKLSNEFKILVITHNEYMKEKFDHVITVHMGPSGSVLR